MEDLRIFGNTCIIYSHCFFAKAPGEFVLNHGMLSSVVCDFCLPKDLIP